MSNTTNKAKHNYTGEGIIVSPFVRIIILLLIVTGVLFWFPAFFQFFGKRSMEIAHLHNTFGLILIIAGIVTFFRQRKKKVTSGSNKGKQNPLLSSDKPGNGLLAIIMKICLLVLILTGLGLTFSQIVPRKVLMVLIYLHGTGAFILTTGVAVLVYQWIAENLFAPTPAAKTDGWSDNICGNSDEHGILISEKLVEVDEFLNAFATALKQSKLKMLLHDSMVLGKSNNIFIDETLLSGNNNNFIRKYSPSDCMVSVYHRYFTLSGWLQGWFSPDKGLTNTLVKKMASLFCGYKTYGYYSRYEQVGNSEVLFAKYGKIIFEQTGIIPVTGEREDVVESNVNNREKE